jgi:DNA recombination protein RmuC
LKTDLGAFKQKIDDNREKEISEYTSLKKEIDSLQKLNQQLSDDAKSLATALKGDVKIQGNWGEDRLLTILEAEGLQEHIDYGKEVSVNDEEWKRQRPDFVVKIPGGRCLVIDSKVSLTAYAAYFNAESIEVKKQALQEHLKSVKNHIELLSGKNYQSIFGAKSPDYTFLFMPIEGALTLALNEDPSLFESAMKKQIVLVTPTNLISTLKIVKMMWQRDNQSKQVEEVFRYSGDLYNKFLSILEDLNRMENALNAAQKSFQDFKNGLSAGATRGATVLGKMEKIGTLQSKYNKTLPENYRRELDALPEEITTKGFNASAVDIDDALIETEDHEPEE